MVLRLLFISNHLLRASHPAMVEVASKILKNERAFESEKINYLQLKILLNLFKMVEAEIFYNFLKKNKN